MVVDVHVTVLAFFNVSDSVSVPVHVAVLDVLWLIMCVNMRCLFATENSKSSRGGGGKSSSRNVRKVHVLAAFRRF